MVKSLFFVVLIAALMGGGFALIYHPESPLPAHWNPTRPLDPKAPITPVTRYQLANALSSPATCRAALSRTGSRFLPLADKVKDDKCHIRNQVAVSSLSTSRLPQLKTRCDTALRLAMWEYHVVQPAARDLFDQEVSELLHFGSYSCRKIRTARGNSNRMSAHATARAIDLSGFRLSNGQALTLTKSWQGSTKEQAFLRRVRDGACDWFRTVLSPDYNRLHHDHFHFAMGKWSSCR